MINGLPGVFNFFPGDFKKDRESMENGKILAISSF